MAPDGHPASLVADHIRRFRRGDVLTFRFYADTRRRRKISPLICGYWPSASGRMVTSPAWHRSSHGLIWMWGPLTVNAEGLNSGPGVDPAARASISVCAVPGSRGAMAAGTQAAAWAGPQADVEGGDDAVHHGLAHDCGLTRPAGRRVDHDADAELGASGRRGREDLDLPCGCRFHRQPYRAALPSSGEPPHYPVPACQQPGRTPTTAKPLRGGSCSNTDARQQRGPVAVGQLPVPRSNLIAARPLGKLEAPTFVNSRFSTSHRDRSVDRYLPASTAARAGHSLPMACRNSGGHRVLPLEPPLPTELERVSRPCLDLPRVIRARHVVRPFIACLPRHSASIAPAANSRQ